MMSDEEFGLDTFIEGDNGDQSVTIVKGATGKEIRLYLKLFPISYQWAIVCRGTSCFRARTTSSEDIRYIVKFPWVSDERQPEAAPQISMSKRSERGRRTLWSPSNHQYCGHARGFDVWVSLVNEHALTIKSNPSIAIIHGN